jgi:hypothetical protein
MSTNQSQTLSALPRTPCSRSDSERIDWLQSQIDASGCSVVMQQGVTNDMARQRTTELRTMVGSGPWQTLQAKHNLRAAIDAAISSENH